MFEHYPPLITFNHTLCNIKIISFYVIKQIWNSKTYANKNLIKGKKIVIPVAQIKNSKSNNKDILRHQKGKKIILAIPKPNKKDKIISKNKIKSGSSSSKSKSKNKIKKSDIQIPLCPFDSLIFLGDLNYRMELPRLEVRACHQGTISGPVIIIDI